MFSIGVEFLSFIFDWVVGFFFSFFDFKLFFNWCWGSSFRCHFTFFLLIFLLLFFNLFFFWNFSFLSPFFNQSTIFESNQTVFSEFDFETNTESFMLRILSWSFVVSNMFIETHNSGLILNKNFDWLSSFEFYCFAGRNFSSEIINHFSLSFWILS